MKVPASSQVRMQCQWSTNRQPLLLPLRRLALQLLASLPLLRRLSLSAMTDGPCRLLRA